METIATTSSNPFLREHPVITQRVLLTSGEEEQTLLAGSVIGKGTSGEGESAGTFQGLFGSQAEMEPVGILAADVTVPASGDAWGTVYVHCAALASGLLWDESCSATDQATAIAALRGLGVFVE